MKRPHLFELALLAAIAGAGAPAHAQPVASPSSQDEILVTGVRDPLKLADRFVDGLTVARSSDPLSRYEDGKYCPAVIGMSERLNQQITDRMRAVASSANVKPAPKECIPTALVIFADNKQSLLAAFRKKHPIYFNDPQRQEDLPPPEAGPAIAWQLVQLLDPQGKAVQRSPSGVGIVESAFGGSRLRSMVQSVVVMSVVVVERKALLGLTPTQIADYAVMRTLTDRVPDLAKMPAETTILKALTAPIGAATAASVTKWDLAYLQGRYSGDPRTYGQSQRAAIRSKVRRAAEGKKDAN